MAYQVIARKWRPQRFSDMVGQEHIARTLKNSIITGRIAHAYLFVGPRGIGKTTSARIFAKALNCLHPIDGEPCCQCSSCKSIADETNVDVIEIDAATHTQVEKARELCEDVLHLPISSKYKIYIIDEVHMLSKSAWNALLKTIEEPPAHAKFIFATTEVNKVLPTVISRCQRFDLRRIYSSDIAARLRLICDQEHVNISDSAIQVIAQAADGGMRDAQSLLDQLISFFGTDGSVISEQQALSLFGLTAPGEMESLIQSMLSNDRSAVISAVHDLSEQGKNLETLFGDILSWLRGILMCRILPDPSKVLEESPERIAVYAKLSQKTSDINCVQRLIENLSASGYLLRDAINRQVFLEAMLLKAMRLSHAVQVEDLIARLNQIRQSGELDALKSVVPLYEMPHGQIITTEGSKFSSGTVSSGKYSVSAEPESAGDGKENSVSGQQTEKSEMTKNESAERVPIVQRTVSQVPENEKCENAASSSIPVSVREEEPSAEETSAAAEVKPEEVRMESPIVKNVMPAETKSIPEKKDPPAEEHPEDAQEQSDSGSDTDNDVSPDDSPDVDGKTDGTDSNGGEPEDSWSSQSPEELWLMLVGDIRETLKKVYLSACMLEGTPESLHDSVLTIAFDSEYEMISSSFVEDEINLLDMRLRDLTGDKNMKISLVRRQGLASPTQIQKKRSMEDLRQSAMENPAVQQALSVFSGRLVDVHDLTEQNI